VFSNGIVQLPVLFEHGSPVTPRNLVGVHANLDHGAIQCAECVEEVVNVGGEDAVRTQFSPWLIWLGHGLALFELTN